MSFGGTEHLPDDVSAGSLTTVAPDDVRVDTVTTLAEEQSCFEDLSVDVLKTSQFFKDVKGVMEKCNRSKDQKTCGVLE